MFVALTPRMIDEWFHAGARLSFWSSRNEACGCGVRQQTLCGMQKHGLNQALPNHIFALSFPVTSHKPSEHCQ
jgi:hypothetical protein